MFYRSIEARNQRLTHQLVVVGWLLVSVLTTPLTATLMVKARLGVEAPHHSPKAADHDARDPNPPTHERHQPFCFLCVLGPVLLVVPPLRLQGRPLAAAEPRLRRDFPARERPFEPQSRSRAPPHHAPPGPRPYRQR